MRTPTPDKGFTLIELIVVIIIIGILAITVIPRFANRSNFDARGFYDTTLATLQYAQKSAVAQRRQVCVTIDASSISLKIDPSYGVNSCANNLAGPDGKAPYTLTAPTGITLSPATTNFSFAPSGVPSAAQRFTVSELPNKTITIDGVSGYVYSN